MRIAQNLILLPVLAQVLLTLMILGILPIARSRSIRERRQRVQDVAIASDTDWNDLARKVSASYKSQFELPVLFYAVCAFALIARMIDPAFVVLAGLFTLSRGIHAAIHIGPNIVAWRFAAFVCGLIILIVMWALLVWRVTTAGF